MSDFVNTPVDVTAIPQLDEDSFVSVHPNLLRVSLIGSAIAAVVVLVVGIIVSAVVPEKAWIPLVVTGGVLALVALGAALRVVEVRHIAYRVRDHDVSYRSGVLTRTVSTIPFVRVQHARKRQGPIERWFGLATVEVNSAGPDLRLAGLGADDAEALKAFVLERAGALVEDQ